MTDIVERLRCWVIATDAVPASDLMDEAADEIERLRNGAVNVRENHQPCQVFLQKYFTLTDEERKAVAFAVSQMRITPLCMRKTAIIRKLLERLT